MAAGTREVVGGRWATLVEGVAILGVEAAGRGRKGWPGGGWDVEAWAAGEDKAIAAEAP